MHGALPACNKNRGGQWNIDLQVCLRAVASAKAGAPAELHSAESEALTDDDKGFARFFAMSARCYRLIERWLLVIQEIKGDRRKTLKMCG